MASLFDSLSDELFNIIMSKGEKIVMYDKHGNRTIDTYKARRFYMKKSKMMISIIENGRNSEVTLYLSNTVKVSDISKFIDSLRGISTRYNIILNVRRFEGDIAPKDFAHEVEPVSESIESGKSYNVMQIGESFLHFPFVERKSKSIFETKPSFSCMVVEKNDGTLINFPSKSFLGARAYAKHIDNGGLIYDKYSESINSITKELDVLKEFMDYIAYNNLKDNESKRIFEEIKYCFFEHRSVLREFYRTGDYTILDEHTNTQINEEDGGGDFSYAEPSEIGTDVGISNRHVFYGYLPVVSKALKRNKKKKKSSRKNSGIFPAYGFYPYGNADYEGHVVEAIISEYGYDKTLWEIKDNMLYAYDVEVYEDIIELSKVFNEDVASFSKVNKIRNFAVEWFNEYYGGNSGSYSTKVDELTNGIENILKGNIDKISPPDELPEFGSANDQILFVLKEYLKTKLNNEMLEEFLKSIISKIENKKQINSSEYIVANKLVSLSGIKSI